MALHGLRKVLHFHILTTDFVKHITMNNLLSLGCIVVWCKIPSRYKSLKSNKDYHRVMLCFSSRREKFHGYVGNIGHLIGYKCVKEKLKHCESDNRMLFSGANGNY